jgi:molecular chaperone DnaK (HSP70)
MIGTAIGIDFGLVESVTAAVTASGETHLITSEEGERTTPNAIYFARDGGTLVGDSAVRAAAADIDRAVLDVRRRLDDEPNWAIDVDGVPFTSVDVAGLIMQKMMHDAEAAVGVVAGAVVTVPSHAHDGQRRVLREAACSAGVPVLCLVNEATAAVRAYAGVADVHGKVLVYDLDDDALDVNVLEVHPSGTIEVLGTNGGRAPTADLITQSQDIIKKALKWSKVKPQHVTAVILAGRCANDTGVTAAIDAVVAADLLSGIDPVEVVAFGAAIEARARLEAQNGTLSDAA